MVLTFSAAYNNRNVIFLAWCILLVVVNKFFFFFLSVHFDIVVRSTTVLFQVIPRNRGFRFIVLTYPHTYIPTNIVTKLSQYIYR